jgi:hypothetical protein
MKLTTAARCILMATLTTVVACGSDSATGTQPAPAKLRIVNSIFQYTDATSTASKTAPRAIDVLIDSSSAAPSAVAIPAVSVFTSASTDSSDYEPVAVGVHSFVATLTGQTGPTASFFTNANSVQYLPMQYLSTGVPYTMVLAGIVPITAAAGTSQTLTAPTAAPFVAITDDPFPPPLVNGKYQARLRIINAAPFAAATGLGATVSLYLTPGSTPPATVTTLSALGAAAYRGASAYVNADAGVYTLTAALSVGSVVLAQKPVTLSAGEVRTFVLQSTGYAATPAAANHTLKSLIDNKY